MFALLAIFAFFLFNVGIYIYLILSEKMLGGFKQREKLNLRQI